ncbi:MAG TPA: hypothetical protein DD400_01400 [Rhodospirillaceae bacterium]|nr:hypothetical protein [Rhodospirillaceae bacterium]
MTLSSFVNHPPDVVLYASCTDSPTGKLLFGLTQDGFLCRLSFAEKKGMRSIVQAWKKEWPTVHFIKSQEEIPFASLKKKKKLLVGTDFQHRVWSALLSIPAGKTLSYGEMAKKIKKPKAARAVGNALGKNPVPLLVPCHRVIAAGGKIGGFSSSLTIKRKLLKREGAL